MYIKVLFVFLLNIFLFSKELLFTNCTKFNNFDDLLKQYNIKINLVKNKSNLDLFEGISNDSNCKILIDYSSNIIEQLIIDINSDIRLHIFSKENNVYDYNFSIIDYEILFEHIDITFTDNKVNDIKQTFNKKQAESFFLIAKDLIDISIAKKNDRLRLLFLCKQKNKVCVNYELVASILTINNKNQYLFNFENNYYNERAELLNSNKFIVPLKYIKITSAFSEARFHPILKKYKAHLGVDYAALKGTPIKAADNGQIIFIGQQGGYGNTIKIKHDNGFETLYAHMNKFGKFKIGDNVKQGQIIGYVGSTGLSTGPHLHFGIYKNKKAVDPEQQLKRYKKITDKNKLNNFYKLIDSFYKILNYE